MINCLFCGKNICNSQFTVHTFLYDARTECGGSLVTVVFSPLHIVNTR